MEEGRISLAVPAFHLCPAVSAAHPVFEQAKNTASMQKADTVSP